jgi:pimeloyl-ACP methyl ester carboxylesterase
MSGRVAGPPSNLTVDGGGTVEAAVLVHSLAGVYRDDRGLLEFRCPTLAVVTPENDCPYSMHRIGTGLPHRGITGTGHWLQIQKPAEFNRILDRFLEE